MQTVPPEATPTVLSPEVKPTPVVFKVLKIIIIGFVIVCVLIILSIIHYFTIKPMSPQSPYYKDILGFIYIEKGCPQALFGCFPKPYSRVNGVDIFSFKELTIKTPSNSGEK